MFPYNHEDAATAWAEGQYSAVFLGATDSTSKSTGQPMQVWTFDVYNDATGKKQTITDYVTAASLFKVRMLASALNRSQEFKENRFFPEDHAGQGVMVALKIESSDQFDDKNKIARISAKLATGAQAAHAAPPASPKPASRQQVSPATASGTVPIDDESIPF